MLRDIAILTAEAGRSLSKKVLFYEYPATGTHAKEPPLKLWECAFGKRAISALKKAGILKPLLSKKATDAQIKQAQKIILRYKKSAPHAVIALSNYSTTHTLFRNLLTKVCGSRYASMPLFDVGMLETGMAVNYKELKKRTDLISKTLRKADSIEIKTSNGTHLKFQRGKRKIHSDTGILTKAGSFGNLPAGEVFLSPIEGTANGKLILEWAPTRRLASPITLIVKEGNVKDVSGSEPYVTYLGEKLNERKENRNIAELGIGTNDMAKRLDNILESEKIMGTIHIALGDNSSFGGNVKTPFHQDFVFLKPTLILIDKKGTKTELMRDGRFIDDV
ncbi:MAG: aminopeptidase [Nitrospirae bacterium]|nr:aminopeptidase [Nitrospirota bacterium]